MSTTSTGRAAEEVAASHLVRQGYTLIDRNWRNRWCELDIVAKKFGVVHFVEVKYRASSLFGHPTEYINHDKLARLTRAALAWTQANGHRGAYQIDVLSVIGSLTEPKLEHLSDITGLG
jgi:putative endonuclease